MGNPRKSKDLLHNPGTEEEELESESTNAKSKIIQELLNDWKKEKPKEEKPIVIIAVAGPKREIPHNYENTIIEYQSDEEETPKFFNRVTTRFAGHYFLFMGKGFNFSTEESLSKLVEIMESPKLYGFGGIYSDLDIMNNGQFMCHKFNPSYCIELVRQQIIMNFPFMVSAKFGLPRFTNGLDLLSLWDGMIQVMISSPMYHVPESLFLIENALENLQIDKEIQIINNEYYS